MNKVIVHDITSILVSGTPRVTGLDGTFFPEDPEATGFDRVWRNKGTGRIYYDNGWKIGDALSTAVYFSEDPEPVSTSVVEWADNPWDVIASNWRAATENLADFRPVLTNIEDQDYDVTETSTTSPYYSVTTDSVFNTVTTYYYYDSEIDSYIRIPVIAGSNKVDTGVYYNNTDGTYALTPDPYFTSSNTYYIKVNDRYYLAPFVNATIPSDTYYVEAGEKTVTTYTAVNKRTGETITSSETTFTKTEIVHDMRKRYYVPDLEVGQIYRFSFVKDFKGLGYMDPTTEDYQDADGENDSDITRGVFKVTNQMTYYKLLLSGVDVYQNLYLPLKISQTVYESDRKKWMNDDVWYELTDPSVPARVFYVPLGIINGIPDANVHEYNRYQLLVDIGIFQDPEFLAEIITDINLLMKAKFGIPTTAKLASYDKVYIPDEYYNWLEEARKGNIVKFMSENADQFYKALFEDKYNTMFKTNIELKKKNQEYEQVITQLAAGGNK